jgi:hypothetical protein
LSVLILCGTDEPKLGSDTLATCLGVEGEVCSWSEDMIKINNKIRWRNTYQLNFHQRCLKCLMFIDHLSETSFD